MKQDHRRNIERERPTASFTFTRDDLDWLVTTAKAERVSRSELLHRAISSFRRSEQKGSPSSESEDTML